MISNIKGIYPRYVFLKLICTNTLSSNTLHIYVYTVSGLVFSNSTFLVLAASCCYFHFSVFLAKWHRKKKPLPPPPLTLLLPRISFLPPSPPPTVQLLTSLLHPSHIETIVDSGLSPQ